jgi:hypothetical protein
MDVISLRGGDINQTIYEIEREDIAESIQYENVEEDSVFDASVSIADEDATLEKDLDVGSKDFPSESDIWAEEIKRLQHYLNNAKSNPNVLGSREINAQSSEHPSAYGAGDDILVLGSDATRENGFKNTDFSSETHKEEFGLDLDAKAEQIDNAGSQKEEVDIVVHDDKARQLSHDPDQESEIYIESSHANTSEIDAQNQVAQAKEVVVYGGINEEESADMLAGEVAEVIQVEERETREDDANVDMAVVETVETITRSLDEFASDDGNAHDNFITEKSITTDQWQAIRTGTASNKLVEEGLRKLRRQDGDEPSVPYVITRAMKKVLVDELGYDEQEVQAMRPDVAVVVVSERLKRPSVFALPPRFYSVDVEPVQMGEPQRESLHVRLGSFVKSLELKQKAVLGSSILLAAYSFVTKDKNAAVSEQRQLKRDEVISQNTVTESSEDTDPTVLEDERKDESSLQRDLDRTWLERLISILTFYK